MKPSNKMQTILLCNQLKNHHKHNQTIFRDDDLWDYSYIQNNLNSQMRHYQTQTIEFFHISQSKTIAIDDYNPNHLLFNMATGSGKTLIMASCILYLFKEQNYQNFLFFAHTDGIVKKTIDNLINPHSSKYLFSKKLEIHGKRIIIKSVNTFPTQPEENVIYIKLTTIQQLYSDLNTVKENHINYDEFGKNPVALLADEAHHYNANTQNTKSEKENAKSWEHCIQKILNTNNQNKLLEFTATLDWHNPEIAKKYHNKVVQKYDLKEFMTDGFSKNVMLLQINQDDKTKMLDAILISQYRKMIANKNNITNFKPVILFKSNNISTSLKKHDEFNTLIKELSPNQIKNHLLDKSKLSAKKTESVWHKVVNFYNNQDIIDINEQIKKDFNEFNILNANSKEFINSDTENILNSLEDNNNPIRVIFAVAKLNEGWDTLNLYDIVRINENMSNTTNNTNSEAQLIGRGARYYPFKYNNQLSQKRQFDNNASELAILEQLHYHTINETSYIKNLNKSFNELNLITNSDGDERVLLATVKNDFKETEIYKNGKIYINKTKQKNHDNITLSSYSVPDTIQIKYHIFDESNLKNINTSNKIFNNNSDDIKIIDFMANIHYFRKAIQGIKFYQFDNLRKYFPNIKSIDDFIKNHLGKIKIKIVSPSSISFDELTAKQKLLILKKSLISIEKTLYNNYDKNIGLKEFFGKNISEVVKDYQIKIMDNNNSEHTQKIESKNMIGKKWFVYNNAIVNGLEKEFINEMESIIKILQNKYDNVYLIRIDERSSQLKFVEFEGVRGFFPDFLLLLTNHHKNIFYQIILEPKGDLYYEKDKWKEQFLKEINGNDIIIEENDKVKLIGIRFYREQHTKEYQDFFDDLSQKINHNEPLPNKKSKQSQQSLSFD